MNLIESNFREIHQSLKLPGEPQLPLAANLSGTRIYDSRYCWGRLWRWFYQVVEWTTGSSALRLNALKSAILHTRTIFEQELEKIKTPLKNYLSYLNICAKGYAVHESAFFPARNTISSWNAATKPFLKLISKTKITDPIFKPLIDLSAESNNSLLKHNLHLCQKIIDVEGLMGGPLPVSIIKKILREIPFNTIDQKILDKWIFKIDSLNIPIKKIHQALQALTDVYSKKNDTAQSKNEQTVNLEFFLEKRGCKVFSQNDEKHLKWRQSLGHGQKLFVNNLEIVLEDEIFSKTFGSDHTRAYSLQGLPDSIALIANNCVELPLRKLRTRNENGIGIKAAQAIEISADGRIALFERMTDLNTLCWTSNEHSISKEDAPLIAALTSLLKTFIKQNFTPVDFSTDTLMLNGQNQLNFIKPVVKGPFDFNAIEDFIFACSGSNQRVFRDLMERSGLIRHPTARFYHDIVKNGLKGNDIDPDDLAGLYKIRDPKVIDRANELRIRIKEMKIKLMLKLREQPREGIKKPPEERANDILLQKYLQRKGAGTFPE